MKPGGGTSFAGRSSAVLLSFSRAFLFHAVFLLAAETGMLVAQTPAATPIPNEKFFGAKPFSNPARFFHAAGSPDYLAFYQERYEYMADHFFAPDKAAEIRRLKEVHFGDAVTAVLWLWESGAGEKYLQRGHDLFGILIGYAANDQAVSRDCFGFSAVLKAALLLKQAGRFDPAWELPLRQFAKDGTSYLNQYFSGERWGDRGYDGNQDLARMYGCLLARALYPEMPDAVSAVEKVNTAFTSVLRQGDIYVDSLNYFGVSFCYLIQIAHELNRESEIANSPSFRRMFANIRDAVTPNGLLPEFGSGYFSPDRYVGVPIVLEYAGALYHDSSFAGPARRYFGMLVRSGPKRDSNIHAAIQNCGAFAARQLLDYFQPWRGPVPSLEFVSGLTRRNTRFGDDHPAFLILRPSVMPGAPMLLMDLLGQGDHCQPEFGASIAYYESDHVPLFYQYGRYVSGASRGNQVVFGPSGAMQPDPEWTAGTWRTFCIPTDRLTKSDGRSVIEHITLRTADRIRRNDAGWVLDNLRLVGPAGTKTICNLSSGNWRGNTHSVVEGSSRGSHAVCILDNGSGCTMSSFQPLEFDPKKYVELLCDVKWFGQAEPIRAQFRPTDDNRSWLSVGDTTLLASLKDVRTERRGGDCWARLEYSPYGTFDSSLVRQIVLTKEGVLAVRDDISSGPSADGRPAFTLWQMYSIDSEGTNRFTSLGECAYPSCDLNDTNSYRRGMSAYFSGPLGTSYGKQIIPNGRGRNYSEIQRDVNLRTAFARVNMRAKQPTYLQLLVVPHTPNADLKRLDALTSTAHDETRSTFQTVCDGQPVRVEILHGGGWLVQRDGPE